MGILLRAALGFTIAFALYAPQSFVAHLPLPALMQVKAEVARFDAAVRDIMQRDGVPKTIAMQTVVREQPRLYEAYQAAAATPSDQGLRPAGAYAT
jgi:hypothetical protein